MLLGVKATSMCSKPATVTMTFGGTTPLMEGVGASVSPITSLLACTEAVNHSTVSTLPSAAHSRRQDGSSARKQIGSQFSMVQALGRSPMTPGSSQASTVMLVIHSKILTRPLTADLYVDTKYYSKLNGYLMS